MSEDVTLEVGDSAYPGRLNTAEEGHHVARFETWMSPAELEGKTDEEFRAELAAGVDFLRSRGCSTVSVVAKSLGGRGALKHLPEGVDRLVLWAPAVLAADAENVPDEAREYLPSVTPSEFGVDVPTGILQGDDDNISVDSAERIAEGLSQGEVVVLPDEDHSFLRDHERVIEETLSFLPE